MNEDASPLLAVTYT